jgi:hypothetical protein
MNFFDWSSQDSWEFVASLGFIMVIVGVGFEIIDLVFRWRKHHREESILVKDPFWLLLVEAASVILVFVGLGVEFGGGTKATLIARQKIASLEATNNILETQIAETRTNLDPINANISEMTATAILMVMGTTFNDLTNSNSGRVAKMTLWKNERMGAALDTLTAENFSRNDFVILFGSRDRREYGIRFHSFNFNAANGIEYPVKTIGDVHIVRMDLSFLPHDSEIAGGMVELVVNNVHKMFQIPRQNDTNSNMGYEPSFPCFVIATNGVQSSEKQFLYLHD